MGPRQATAPPPRSRLAPFRAAAIALALATPACTGILGDPDGTGQALPSVDASERSQFPRLTHAQWENTVKDLLRLDALTGISASFTGDPLGGVFDNNELMLQVTPTLWQDYQIAAEELSALVTSDPALLAGIVPAEPADPAARAEAFITSFGRRAFRRPLTGDEIDRFTALFSGAPEILPDIDPFTAGVQLTLQAMLQSPFFLYRTVLSDAPRDDGLIPLSGYENAANLAFFLWNTMPDDPLLDAAGAGELSTPEGVRAYAEVLLNDPRARAAIGSFHRQLLDYERYHDLYKDPALFPNFTAETGVSLEREAELFVEHVIFERGSGLAELLTSPKSFVNAELASIYGLSGTFADDFQEVDLDAAQRSGLLTRAGFLAAHGTATQPDTIHRGVFVNLRLICAKLPPPPDNATAVPPSNEGTNRDRIDAHTGEGTCGASCHGTMINPIGYAFENYDAIGQFRTTDNNLPIDASASYNFEGGVQSYANAMELSQILAESPEVHRCYTKHWLEFGLGRDAAAMDAPLIEQLAEGSMTGLPVKELILELVQSDSFLTRAPVEAP
jgi:hypothetical protein